jgi:hypothetical protein
MDTEQAMTDDTYTPSLEENLWPAAAADRGERE